MTVGDLVYHPECFVCSKCGGQLSGKFSKDKEGNLICPNCIPKKICDKCKKPLSGPFAKVGDKSYHKECFVCFDCKGPLSGGFTEKGGEYYCKTCIEKSGVKVEVAGAAPKGAARKKCRACKKPIDGGFITGDKDDVFHEECFKCALCGVVLDEFVVDNGRQFKFQEAHYICLDCNDIEEKKAEEERRAAEEKAPKCCICKQEVDLGNHSVMKLLDGTILHITCLKCMDCGKLEFPSGKVEDDHTSSVLLRSKVIALKENRYRCEACSEKAPHTVMEFDAPERHKQVKAVAPSGPAIETNFSSPADVGPMTLADLQDANVYQAKNIDPKNREKYLSDEDFQAIFHVDKSSFDSQPKWKKDKAKREHKLF